jgi:hypothetical protein
VPAPLSYDLTTADIPGKTLKSCKRDKIKMKIFGKSCLDLGWERGRASLAFTPFLKV